MRTKLIPDLLPQTILFFLSILCVMALGLWALATGASASPSRSGLTYAVPSLQAPQPAGAPLAPLCGPNWSVISSPSVGPDNNALYGVAAVSASDVWAVGDYYVGGIIETLVEHWDGTSWNIVTSPSPSGSDNELRGVAAVSASDVWAVGSYGGSIVQTLVEHWDGTSWNIVASPNVGSHSNALYGVAAVSANDVWAVGDYIDDTSGYHQTLAEHWNGTLWNIVASPNVGTNSNTLYGVAAVSANDVWAVGNYYNGTVLQTLAEQFNGSVWTVITSPNVGTSNNYLYGVAAVSASDVWSGGYYYTSSAILTLVEHWNGSAWTVITSPNAGLASKLYGVAAVSANDVWAVGTYNTSFADQTLVEHWNGSAWQVVTSPSPGPNFNYLYAVAAVSASDVWSGGYYYTSPADRTLVERYNPCPPTATPTSTSTFTPISTPTFTPISTPTSCPIQFTDVPSGSTFYFYIRCLACRGIINGYADGTFKPNNNVTRGQLSKIVSNAAGFHDNQTTQTFEDVPVGSTFFQFVGRLASRSFIGGYTCGGAGEPCVPPANLPYFRPNNNSTRGQISKIVSNAAGFSDTPSGQQFQDVAAGSTYYTYIYRLVSRSIMAGYQCGGAGEPCVPPGNLPYFRPNNNATRGQTSKIVSNTFYPNCQTPQRR